MILPIKLGAVIIKEDIDKELILKVIDELKR